VAFADIVAWRKALKGDIELIRAAKLRPRAIVLRLKEIVAGVKAQGNWYEFSAPGRGISGQMLDLGVHQVVLEFTHRKDSRAVQAALEELMPKFTVISNLTAYDHAYNDGASIRLEFPIFRPPTGT